MRLIDAQGSELQAHLKIIREAEYQIYGSGSWGFTAKCEHAIEDAPTVHPEPHWIPVTERLPEESGLYQVTDMQGNVVRYVFNANEGSVEYWRRCVKAWMPLPEPFKEVTE